MTSIPGSEGRGRSDPHWRAQEGERAYFSTWFESRWGPDTNFSVDDLAALAGADLVDRLHSDMIHRSGLLDSWRQLAHAQPEAALDVLKSLAASADSGPPDVREAGLPVYQTRRSTKNRLS